LEQRLDNTPIKASKTCSYVETINSTIRFFLYLLVVIIPLAISPSSLNQALSLKYLLFKLVTAVVICVYLTMIVLRGAKIRVSGLELPLAIFLIFMGIATMLSANIHTSIEGSYIRYDGFLSYLICAALFFAATQSFFISGQVETIVKLSIATATIVSVYGVAQSQGCDPIPWGVMMFEKTRSFSTFGNPVILSGYLSLMFPLAIALLKKSKSSVDKLLYSVAVTAIALCLVTTMSRAAWMGGIIGLVLVVAGLAQKKRFNIRMAAAPTVISIVVISLASMAIGLPTVAHKATSTFGFSGSVDSRLLMWGTALKMIPQRPLFGFGPDVLDLVFPRYEIPGLLKYNGSAAIDNVHNAFLQLALTAGIPALIAFIVILVVVFIKALREIKRSQSVSPITVGLVAGIIAFLAQSLTGVTGIATSGFLWLNMGLLASIWAEPKIELKPVTGFAKYPLLSSIIVVGIIGVVLSIRPFISENALGQAWLATQHGDSRAAESFYKKAIVYNPQDDKAYSGFGIMLAYEGYALKNMRLWSEGMNYLKGSTQLSSHNRENYTLLGLGYLYGGKVFDERNFRYAVTSLEKAAELGPNNYTTRDLLGMAYLEAGRMEEAKHNLLMALRINPNDPQTHYHMGRYYEKAGHKEDALCEYIAAVMIDKNYKDAKTAYERLIKRGND